MSQRPSEVIHMTVPTSFSKEDIEEFKQLLINATSHGKWENLTILLTNKSFEYTVVDRPIMDVIKRLDKKYITRKFRKDAD